MDDYQKHLERQLQQQQAQMHSSAGPDMTTARLGNAPILSPATAPAGRGVPGQQPPPQWPGAPANTNMNMPGVGPTPGNIPSYGRPLAGNPMGINAASAQSAAAQQSFAQPLVNVSPSGPQGPLQQQQITAPVPRTKTQTSPIPNSPTTSDSHWEKKRIATILEINSHLIKLCVTLQPTVSAENILQDPTYSGCLIRLQQNLAYLAAIADRAHKHEATPQKPLPHIQVFTAPPMIRTPEEKEALDKLYKVLWSLQPNSESANGDASGSESGSQVNSPQVRSRQTSAGSSQPSQGGPQQPQQPQLQQHVHTPPTPRSQLPAHAQHSTPSPHLTTTSLHGQSGLNPNPIRPQPQGPQQPPFQPSYTQNPGFPLNQNPQFHQMAQQPAYQQQLQQLQHQGANQQFNPQNPSLPLGMQPQFQQFQQNPQSFPQQQPPPPPQQQQQQQAPHLQPRVPSRPPSRPTSQQSGTGPSPSISPGPLSHGPSPQLTSTPTPVNNTSPRAPMPNAPVQLTPEQQAILQERARLARETRMQQLQHQAAASRSGNINPSNIFPTVNGIPQQGNAFPSFSNPTMMNGTQNQNFGAGGGE